MALRRPPTALTLKPSDVNDLKAFLRERDAAAAPSLNTQASTQAGPSTAPHGRDSVVAQERRDREEREARTQRARIIGQ
ncbi:hypothetical protein JCM10212_002589 [Sporobolomyces blumeae]